MCLALQMQTMSRMMALSGGAQGERSAPSQRRAARCRPRWHVPAHTWCPAQCVATRRVCLQATLAPGNPAPGPPPLTLLAGRCARAGLAGMPQMSDEEMMEAVMGSTGDASSGRGLLAG